MQNPEKKYGKLLKKKSEVTPCHTACVDLVGPRTEEISKGNITLNYITITCSVAC